MPRVLVVDDEDTILGGIRSLLEAHGYEVHAVSNGKDAIELLKTREFHLMICDICMAPVDGMEVLKHADASPHRPAVIMLTGSPTARTATASLRYDVYDYLLKPFDAKRILESVENALDRREKIVHPPEDASQQEEAAAGSKRESLKKFLREEDDDCTDDVPKLL